MSTLYTAGRSATRRGMMSVGACSELRLADPLRSPTPSLRSPLITVRSRVILKEKVRVFRWTRSRSLRRRRRDADPASRCRHTPRSARHATAGAAFALFSASAMPDVIQTAA